MSKRLFAKAISRGVHTERSRDSDSKLDLWYRRFTSALSVVRVRRRFLEDVVRNVNAHGSSFEQLSDREISRVAHDLRRRLRISGLDRDTIACSFALVREAASLVLGQRHHDVQVMGGWGLLQGMVTEMETGEGKTLTATLAAGTAALAGVHVHVITVNDYLAQRDAEWMGPIYKTLGIRVGVVTHDMEHEVRRNAYSADVTYCTNKQVVFDYLRDKLMLGRSSSRLQLELARLAGDPSIESKLLLRGLQFAIVDELDSILIDEAITPLIIAQRQVGGEDQEVYKAALVLADRLKPELHFRLDKDTRRAELTALGCLKIQQLVRSREIPEVLSAKGKRLQDLVLNALTAKHFFLKDVHYIVRGGKVQIIDEYTGRTLLDRSWQDGLHQAIEAKERCLTTALNSPVARISYQKFFRRYLKLSGMTGTAREVTGELAAVYGMPVLKVPTHKPVRRTRNGARIFLTKKEKQIAIVERVRELYRMRRAVLVGTRSVEASEQLSVLLNEAGLPHRVLNARQDKEEAETIQQAGQPSSITVATNMAGRGTDIRVHPHVVVRGGLHVIASELHDSCRIDRQLFGRCGRQGEPGSYEVMLSFEDELVSTYATRLVEIVKTAFSTNHQRIAAYLGGWVFRCAQRAAERRHRRLRHSFLKTTENVDSMLSSLGVSE